MVYFYLIHPKRSKGKSPKWQFAWKTKIRESPILLIYFSMNWHKKEMLFITFFQVYLQQRISLIFGDLISSLSATKDVNEQSFRSIMKYLFSFIEKEKQSESLVEKLCHRFIGTKGLILSSSNLLRMGSMEKHRLLSFIAQF